MSATGTVHRINVSNGGVPKLPVEEAEVTVEGVAGDRQRNRWVHGGPLRAVCLLALETIERLSADGHPITPGAAGENLTVAGIDWTRLRPGVRLRIGAAVLLQVTAYTVPCRTIAACFADGDITRLAVERDPSATRVYARVLTPGLVRTGDPVEID
jgi:MOSC domain-containing protein YiiM